MNHSVTVELYENAKANVPFAIVEVPYADVAELRKDFIVKERR